MRQLVVPDDIRRFIFTSIESVPYLEAMLLLRGAADCCWDARLLSQRLYTSEKKAAALLDALNQAGLLSRVPENAGGFLYRPASPELAEMVDRLAACYGSALVEVTNLIHSRHDKKAHQFADAFRWRKDS